MATATLLPEAETATNGRDLSELLYEVIDGIIVEKPPMGAYEMSLANWLGVRLANYVEPLRIGRAWVEMLFDSPRDRRGLAYIDHGRAFREDVHAGGMDVDLAPDDPALPEQVTEA